MFVSSPNTLQADIKLTINNHFSSYHLNLPRHCHNSKTNSRVVLEPELHTQLRLLIVPTGIHFPWFSCPWQFARVSARYTTEYYIVWVPLTFFSKMRPELWAWGKHSIQHKCSSHCTIAGVSVHMS